MRFQVRLFLWALTGVLQQLLVIVLGALSAAAGATLLLAVLGSLGARLIVPSIERRLDERWAKTLSLVDPSFDDRVATARSPSAALLEQVAAEMGIRLALIGAPDRPQPAPGTVADLNAVAGDLLAPGRIAGWLPSPEYEDWRERHRTRIAEAIGVILDQAALEWDNDLERMPSGPGTNLAGHHQLHRVVATEAVMAARAGDAAALERTLDAAWRFSVTLGVCPQLAAHETVLDNLTLQLPVTRELAPDVEPWPERLASLDLERHALRAYLLDTWQLGRRSEALLGDRHGLLGYFVQPFARALALYHRQAILYAVAELPGRDAASFDPNAFAAEIIEHVPRWNTVVRSRLPSTWSSWLRTLRGRLDADLTARVLELRLAGDTGSTIEPEPRQPTVVDGIDWLYRVSADTVSITLDPQLFTDDEAPALAAVLELGRRRSARHR